METKGNMIEAIRTAVANSRWGYLRETTDMAKKAGIDEDTGLFRTGLEEYLDVIFPEIKRSEWVHDKCISGSGKRCRPDYRCEKIKLIIEFDGLQHYQQPDKILKDIENQIFYEGLGYTVVRIPYFIQLTNSVVKKMFGRDVTTNLFDPNIPSMGENRRNSPAYCCYAGLERMVKEFHKYPEQYKVNIDFLDSQNNDFLTGASVLREHYNNKKQ